MSAVFSKTISSTSSAGLRKKPTYEELINYIKQDPDTIRYPNRDATIIADSYEYNKSVGEGFRQMAMMSDAANSAAKDEALLRRFASREGMDFGKLRTLLETYGVRPVDAAAGAMGSDAKILHTLPDLLGSLNGSNSTLGYGPFAGYYAFPADGGGGGGGPPPDGGGPPPPGGGGGGGGPGPSDEGPAGRMAPEPSAMPGPSDAPAPSTITPPSGDMSHETHAWDFIFHHPAEFATLGLGLVGMAFAPYVAPLAGPAVATSIGAAGGRVAAAGAFSAIASGIGDAAEAIHPGLGLPAMTATGVLGALGTGNLKLPTSLNGIGAGGLGAALRGMQGMVSGQAAGAIGAAGAAAAAAHGISAHEAFAAPHAGPIIPPANLLPEFQYLRDEAMARRRAANPPLEFHDMPATPSETVTPAPAAADEIGPLTRAERVQLLARNGADALNGTATATEHAQAAAQAASEGDMGMFRANLASMQQSLLSPNIIRRLYNRMHHGGPQGRRMTRSQVDDTLFQFDMNRLRARAGITEPVVNRDLEANMAAQVSRSAAEAQAREAMNEARAASGVVRRGIGGLSLPATGAQASDEVANALRRLQEARNNRLAVEADIRSRFPNAQFYGPNVVLQPPPNPPPMPMFPIPPGYVPPQVPTDFNPTFTVPRPPMPPGYVPPPNATAPAIPAVPPPTTPRPPVLPGGMRPIPRPTRASSSVTHTPTPIRYTPDEMIENGIDHLNYLENVREALIAHSNGVASLAHQQLLAYPGRPSNLAAVSAGITVHLNALQRHAPGRTLVWDPVNRVIRWTNRHGGSGTIGGSGGSGSRGGSGGGVSGHGSGSGSGSSSAMGSGGPGVFRG